MRDWWLRGLPSALTLRTFGAGAPLIPFMAGLMASSASEGLLPWIFFGSAGYLVTVVAALLVSPMAESAPSQRGRWLTLLLMIAAGPATLWVAVGLAQLAGLAPPTLPVMGSTLLATLLAVWLIGGARLSSLLASDDHDREVLLRAVAREKALALDSSRVLEAHRLRLLHDIRDSVTTRLILQSTGGTEGGDASAGLRALIDEAVRPLSHQLHEAQVNEDELVEQLSTLQVPRARFMITYASSLQRADRGDLLLAAGLLVAAAMATITGAWVGVGWVIGLIPLAYTLLLTSFVALSSARSTATREELADALTSADHASTLVRQGAWVTRRQLANTMHGEVQGRILACALHIQDMSADEARVEIDALAADLQLILAPDRGDGDWQVAWERLITMWDHSINLRIDWDRDVDGRLHDDAVAGSALVAVAGEAITNAVRHGGAQTVVLAVHSADSQALLLDVVDDGVAAGTGTPSLGTSTLDAVCLRWSLQAHPAGHHLQAVVPLRQGREKAEGRG